MPDLIAALEADPDMSVRASAAAALGGIGSVASAAIPALRRAAGNPRVPITHDSAQGELRVRAQMAIDHIENPPPR
ncbi:HEAT repeat domain-containing protein [Planctomycetota bacterium]